MGALSSRNSFCFTRLKEEDSGEDQWPVETISNPIITSRILGILDSIKMLIDSLEEANNKFKESTNANRFVLSETLMIDYQLYKLKLQYDLFNRLFQFSFRYEQLRSSFSFGQSDMGEASSLQAIFYIAEVENIVNRQKEMFEEMIRNILGSSNHFN